MESREIKRIMSAKELPDVMTMPIVARTLGCSLNTAYALLNRQDFPRSVAGNRVYIDKEKFRKYCKRYSPYGTVASFYLWAVSGGAIPELTDPAVKK